LKVQREGRSFTVEVTADGEGLVSHAGTALLTQVADKCGVTEALSRELSPMRERRSAHDPGHVVRDLGVMLASGGEALTDLGALREQAPLFGEVASDSTAYRAIERIASEPELLAGLRAARKQAREHAWELGLAPQRVTIDLDATLLGAHSEKEGAAGNFKGGALNPSTQRCLQGICRRLKVEGLPRPGVQLGGDRVELRLRELR